MALVVVRSGPLVARADVVLEEVELRPHSLDEELAVLALERLALARAGHDGVAHG